MRSIWKGSIEFGLVSVPIKVYSASEEQKVKFHQAHNHDQGRIRYKRVCETCGQEVSFADISKLYEADDGRCCVITDEDIESLPAEKSRSMEVQEFVPVTDIDPMMYDRTYFLEPDAKSPKAYQMLSGALDKIDHVALVKFTLRSRERMAVLRVKQYGQRKVILVHTLLWPDEIRVPDFPILDRPSQVSDKEAKMADLVVESLKDRYKPDQHVDHYREQLMELIEAKLEGEEAFEPEEIEVAQPSSDVDDLLAKLQASIAARDSVAALNN